MKIKKQVLKILQFHMFQKTIQVNTRGIIFPGTINHFEFVYLYRIKKSLIYINGVLKTDVEKSLLDSYDFVGKLGLKVAVIGGGKA